MTTRAWGVLTSRNVAWYLVGNTVSNIGGFTFNVAAAILVYRLTGSTFLVGAVSFAQFLGALVLAPWAGSAADQFDRRKLQVVLQLCSALVASILALATALGHANAAFVIGMTTLLGLTVGFGTPAMQALVPLLVEPRNLDVAVATNSATFNFARAVGPLIAAGIITWWGVAAAFSMNALSFLFFVTALLVIRPRVVPRVSRDGRGMFRASVVTAWRDVRIRRLLISVAVVSIVIDPVSTLSPEYASRVLGMPDATVGYIMGAFGVGATLGALLIAPLFRARRHGLGVAMSFQAVGILGFAIAPNLPVVLVALALAGIGFIGASTRTIVGLNKLVPESELGRLMALWSVAYIGSRPFAALVDGAIAEVFGPRLAAAMMAIPVIVVAALVFTRWAPTAEPAAMAAAASVSDSPAPRP